MTDIAITGKTAICGIIGDPVEHTISPAMHNASFREAGLDYVYIPLRVKREDLGKAVAGIRALNIRGMNVTIPHKVAVIPLLDSLDPLAEKIGALNTIVNTDGRLKGYNTDAAGFRQALQERGVEPGGKRVVILGAGGAARAIAFTLAEGGADLVILNRQTGIERARQIAGTASHISGKTAVALTLEEGNLRKVLPDADVLVNATSVGMRPNSGETLVPAGLLREKLVVFDIVYNPLKTRLLAEAESAGATVIDGLNMLVWQGAMAFELWTGVKAPVELMKKVGAGALAKQ